MTTSTKKTISKDPARESRAIAKAADILRFIHTYSDEVMLTEAQVAVVLGIHPGTLRNRRSLGDPHIPYSRVSAGCVRYRLGDVRAALRERTVRGLPPIGASTAE
jgi:hypothetical protein